MKLEKGGLILVCGIWYVIVNIRLSKEKVVAIDCICDHANNIHSWHADEVEIALTLKDMSSTQSSSASERVLEAVSKRSIPWEVVVEVLSGEHDDSFDHWYKDEL